MKIQMTRTIQGSLDGVTVRELVDGEQYDTVDSPRGERLAGFHIRNGDAIPAPVAVMLAIEGEPVESDAAPAKISAPRQKKA